MCNILVRGDAMENTVRLQPKKLLDDDALFLTSSIFVGANRTIRDIHLLVAALLRYALIGASIPNDLMGLMVENIAEEH